MSRHPVRLLSRARSDVDHIFRWLLAHSPIGAEKWSQALLSGLRALEQFPEACGFASEAMLRERGVRQKLFKSRRGRVYRLLFVIVDSEVRILRVRGPGQPPLGSSDVN